MAEEIKNEEQVIVETPKADPYDEKNWSDAPIISEEKKEEVKEVVKTELVSDKKEEQKEEIFDEDVFIKNKFGFDTVEAAQAAIAELRSKAETKSEIKFADEQSRRIHELLKEGKKKEVTDFLKTQEKLESYLTKDITKETASDIIKLSIQLKNKDLTEDEIEFEYKQNYVAPKEPVQRVSETDDEFSERKEEWQVKVDAIEMKRIIAAKMAKPELEKLKTELTLPDIKKDVDPKVSEAENQKILEAANQAREKYLATLKSDSKNFNGFSVTYKDETVEIPLSLNPPEEEKNTLIKELENFDVDGYILNRWFDKEGNPNVQKIMEDRYLLDNTAKVLQKLVNDAGNKRLEHHLKTKSNIEVNGKSADGTFKPDGDKTDQQKMAEFFWSQS